jgi:cytosine/adenosine deaminase-related metal-dependent hydrolase
VTGEGFINAHTHLYSGLAPLGMPAPDPQPQTFVQILERIWWRLDRALDHESLDASARFYVAHALLTGTTGLVDHHESPGCIEGSLDVLADACQDLGMHAVLTYGATERNGGREEAAAGLAECRRFLETNERPLVRGVVGLHAPFTVSDDTLREAGELAREMNTVVHLHLAEDGTDGEHAREMGYAGPLDRLLELNAVPPGSILAHGVHLTEEEVRRCASAGLWLVQNPRSNTANGVGAPLHLSCTDRSALGTDGFPSDPAAELAALSEDPATSYARLEGGHRLLAERFDNSMPVEWETTASDSTQHLPRHLMVAGRIIVQDGVLMTALLETIDLEAARQAERLWTRMADVEAEDEA